MPPRRPDRPSHHWAKPIGLSLSVHLAAYAAIPVLLGLGIFALSGGGGESPPALHELRFETAALPAEPDAQDPVLEPLGNPTTEALDEWPPLEWPMDGDLLPESPSPEWEADLDGIAEVPAPNHPFEVPVAGPELAELEPVVSPETLEPEPSVDTPSGSTSETPAREEPKIPTPDLDPDPTSEIEPPAPAENAPEATTDTWVPALLTEFCPDPHYPAKARRMKQAGAVLLLLTVQPDGHVSDAQVEQSSGHPALDRAAQKTLATWRFQPAPFGWQNGPKQVRRRVLFRLP